MLFCHYLSVLDLILTSLNQSECSMIIWENKLSWRFLLDSSQHLFYSYDYYFEKDILEIGIFLDDKKYQYSPLLTFKNARNLDLKKIHEHLKETKRWMMREIGRNISPNYHLTLGTHFSGLTLEEFGRFCRYSCLIDCDFIFIFKSTLHSSDFKLKIYDFFSGEQAYMFWNKGYMRGISHRAYEDLKSTDLESLESIIQFVTEKMMI